MAKNKKASTQVKEHPERNVSVIGYSSIDITVFMAIAINKLGHTVLIADLSPEKDIINALSPGEYAPVIERYGITATEDLTEYDKSKYELLVTYYGRNIESALSANKNDLQILATDMYASHAKLLSSIPSLIQKEDKKKNKKKADKLNNKSEIDVAVEPEQTQEPEQILEVNTETEKYTGQQVIVLNELSKIKYGPKYLLSVINHKEIKDIYQLHFNTTDLETKLSIGHEKIKLKTLTENYKTTLNKLVGLVLEGTLTKAQIKRIYK